MAQNKGTVDLRTCGNLEFEAWFKSIMLQEHTRISIKRIVNNKTYLNKLPDKKLNYMAENLSFYFKARHDDDAFINYVLKQESRREDLVKFIRIMKTIYPRKIFSQNTKFISRALGNTNVIYKKGSSNMNILLCRLVNYMFIDNVINWKLDILNKSKAVKHRGSIAAKIRKTKEVLESIANEISSK